MTFQHFSSGLACCLALLKCTGPPLPEGSGRRPKALDYSSALQVTREAKGGWPSSLNLRWTCLTQEERVPLLKPQPYSDNCAAGWPWLGLVLGLRTGPTTPPLGLFWAGLLFRPWDDAGCRAVNQCLPRPSSEFSLHEPFLVKRELRILTVFYIILYTLVLGNKEIN